MYSETLLDHFDNPRYVGPLEHYQGYARRTNPVCGDTLELWAENRDHLRLAFRASGCVPVLAVGSLLAEYCNGRSLEEVRRIDRTLLQELVGPLPRSKKHAVSLAVRTLEEALKSLNGTQE